MYLQLHICFFQHLEEMTNLHTHTRTAKNSKIRNKVMVLNNRTYKESN